jgi:hypothetical protein
VLLKDVRDFQMSMAWNGRLDEAAARQGQRGSDVVGGSAR